MVLDDVTDDAILIEIAAAPLCAKVLTENNLHVADVLPAPQGLEHQVGEPQHLHNSHTCTGSTPTVFMFVGFYMFSIMLPIYCLLPRASDTRLEKRSTCVNQAPGVQPPPASKSMSPSDFCTFAQPVADELPAPQGLEHPFGKAQHSTCSNTCG
jgi:hypothetical protein